MDERKPLDMTHGECADLVVALRAEVAKLKSASVHTATSHKLNRLDAAYSHTDTIAELEASRKREKILNARIEAYKKLLDYISTYEQCRDCGAPRIIAEFRESGVDLSDSNKCSSCEGLINAPGHTAPEGATLCSECAYEEYLKENDGNEVKVGKP